MVFNSVQFLIFLPVVVLTYYLVPCRAKNFWLLLTSYFFYLCWHPAHLPVLLFVTVVTHSGGLLVEKARRKGLRMARCWLAAAILLDFLPLFLLKYLNFVINTCIVALSHVGVVVPAPGFDWLLPMGISFYTLQAVGYMIDVYRGTDAEHNLLHTALFVAFFPQMVSGPISRSKSLLTQFRAPKRIRFDQLRDGALLMIWGYYLKMVIADRAGIFVDAVYEPSNEYEGWYLIVATLLFIVQLYCDFAGCTTIAMGAAKWLGIDLPDNFQAPFLSRSNAEFWRRWHISLSTWFRDYLYIPLGGNRKGKWKKYVNVLITFTVSGLWHGAQWTFIAWGLLNGVWQVAGDLLRPIRQKLLHILALDRDTLSHKAVQTLCTMVCVCLAFVFFRASRLMEAFDILKSMFTATNIHILFDGSLYECGLDAFNFHLLMVYLLILFGSDLCKYKQISIRRGIAMQSWLCQVLVVAGGVLAVLLLGVYGPGFEASNFIYSQF